jgi:NAD(P) transhydrogenase subunit alpha
VNETAFVPYLFGLLLVFALAIFVGFEVISKVPTTLHTPLMSATNAIHGVVLVGAIFIVGGIFKASLGGPLLTTLALVAVTLGTINVVGGFAVTERMLQMFKKKEPARK